MGASKKASAELEVSASGSLKCKTWVLRVPFHCDGCKRQVKQALQKLKGVYEVKIDSEQSKVTVVGNVSSDTLLKKLLAKGKHAEIIAESSSSSAVEKPKDNGIGDKPYDLRPVKHGAATTGVNQGTMEEQSWTNGRAAAHFCNHPNHGSSAFGRYSRPYALQQQPGTFLPTTKYGHGNGKDVPNNTATGLGPRSLSATGVGGDSSHRIVNRQYASFANKASSRPTHVTGWVNAKPSKNQWVAYDQTTRHHSYQTRTNMPGQSAAPTSATSTASMLRYNSRAHGGGYDRYHQYIPSQPSAHSDVVHPEKSSRRSQRAHNSGNSLDIFSEENPNACSIM